MVWYGRVSWQATRRTLAACGCLCVAPTAPAACASLTLQLHADLVWTDLHTVLSCNAALISRQFEAPLRLLSNSGNCSVLITVNLTASTPSQHRQSGMAPCIGPPQDGMLHACTALLKCAPALWPGTCKASSHRSFFTGSPFCFRASGAAALAASTRQ